MKPTLPALVFTCALTVSVAVPVSAQQDEPVPANVSARDKRRARNHFERATRHLDAQRYDRAIASFEKAYELFPSPDFLFNIGDTHRLAGNDEQAIEYMLRYLDAAPEGRGAGLARQTLMDLGYRAEPTPLPSSDLELPPDVTPDAFGEAEAPPPPAIPGPPAEAPPNAGRALTVASWTTAGVGVVGLAVATGFALQSSSIASDVEEAEQWSPALQARYEDGEAAERNAILFGAVGGAALVASGVLFYLRYRKAGPADERADRFVVSPTVAPGTAGVAVTGEF